jgi:tetrapyrrole methylase family protein / MazG family protein
MKNINFSQLVKIMARLRAPGGCPWDRAQTHASLLRYLKEESNEVAVAVRKKDMKNLAEELGDVLLQVLFHAEIAQERGDFDINDIITILGQKLIKRHPHVFKKRKGDSNLTPEEVVRRWKIMKRKEKRGVR